MVEVLVALFIVSITAVNIAGLQKIIGDQNRDNSSHVAVINLVSEKMEALQYQQLQDVLDLNGRSEIFNTTGTDLALKWQIESVPNTSTASAIRLVSITASWLSATGEPQTYTYSEQLSFTILSAEDGDADSERFPVTVVNLLATNKIDYFEMKMGYNLDAYVIYNSQLFQATQAHGIADGQVGTIPPPINKQGVVADGWDKLGRIDDPELANLFID